MITKVIKNHKLEFNEETHKYTVDGKPCYSVTQVIAWKLKNKYSDISSEILLRAALHGNQVHSEIEDYEMLGAEGDETTEEFKDYLWLKSVYKWTVTNSEVFIILPFHDSFICGRFDLLATIDDFKYIVDIKTTATLDKASLCMQLTLYKMAYEYSYDESIDYLAYIWLNSKGNNSIRKFGEIKANEKFINEMLEDFYNYITIGF